MWFQRWIHRPLRGHQHYRCHSALLNLLRDWGAGSLHSILSLHVLLFHFVWLWGGQVLFVLAEPAAKIYPKIHHGPIVP